MGHSKRKTPVGSDQINVSAFGNFRAAFGQKWDIVDIVGSCVIVIATWIAYAKVALPPNDIPH